MNPHNWTTAIDPPGTDNRRWQCQYCSAVGTLDELYLIECTHEYPPCVSCGQTPLCAPDCKLIIAVLASVPLLGRPAPGKPS